MHVVVAPWIFICLTAALPLFEAMPCNGSAYYKLTFQAEWTQQSHPKDFPSDGDPHFSPVVGCTHNSLYVMWKPGMNATKGVEDVAHLGRNHAINKEIDQQISRKTVLYKFQGRTIGNTGTEVVNDIKVNTKYPLVSAITMIAPSPDWFVGVHDYSLCNETTGEWVHETVKDLFLYDAGTRSPSEFIYSENLTIPQEPIFLITNTHEGSLKSNTAIKRFGTFTFEKTSEAALRLANLHIPVFCSITSCLLTYIHIVY